MNLLSAKRISAKYGLQCRLFDYNKTLFVHFLNGASGFTLATKRRKRDCPNDHYALLEETTEAKFRALCRKAQHHPKSEAERDALQIVTDFEKYVGTKTKSNKSAKYYPQFRLFSLLGDGFSVARFVFSEDFQQVFFVFSDDQTLQYPRNPHHIPMIFPVVDLPQWLAHVKI
jgi:hypothetical protein